MKKYQVWGHVRFPIKSSRWRHIGDEGTVVRLVVVPKTRKRVVDTFCVVSNVNLVGDDKRPKPAHPDASREHFLQYRWRQYHDDADDRWSRPYVAVVNLGCTNWVGFDEAAGENWTASYDDLTPAGREIYDTIKRAFPRCNLHILTMIDT